MIKGHCFTTNPNRYTREIWPTKFVEVPKIGDLIMAESELILKVVSRTFYMARIRTAENRGEEGDSFGSVRAPRIRIGLGA